LGEVTWIRKTSPTGLFAPVFTNFVQVQGSNWSNSMPLGLADDVVITNGGLTTSLLFAVSLIGTNLAAEPGATNIVGSLYSSFSMSKKCLKTSIDMHKPLRDSPDHDTECEIRMAKQPPVWHLPTTPQEQWDCPSDGTANFSNQTPDPTRVTADRVPANRVTY
jgi:hypothetical protein